VAADFDAFQTFTTVRAGETRFTSHYVGEPPLEREKTIATFGERSILLAFDGGRIVGQLELKPHKPGHPRIKYNAEFSVSVLREYWGDGLGSFLMNELDKEAARLEFRNITGIVDVENLRAMALYLKHGFVVVGHLPEALYVDGRWVGIYYIAKRF
jgi:RimJ/RimL family protein N-acetyltransferase